MTSILTSAFVISTIIAMGVLPSALADRGDACFEKMDGNLCGLLDAPFEAMLHAYDGIFGDLTIAVLWGILIAVLWMKVQNTALVGIVGLVLAGSIVGLSEESLRVGLLLVAVSMGILLFQLVQQRIKYPQ